MATLPVPSTDDFSADTLSNITLIDFTNAAVAAIATFASSQFDNVQISTTVAIDGTPQINGIIVNGGNLNASEWIFTNWLANDTVTLNGGASGDTIKGSSKNDTITGGLGVDTLAGGDGDDTFVYNSFAEHDAISETVSGGSGTADTLRINVGQGFSVNVAPAGALTGVEKVVFAAAGACGFSGDNFGTAAGLVNEVTGSTSVNTIFLF